MQGKQWQPFTKLVWLVLLIGVPVTIFGWPAVLIFAAVNVAIAFAIGAVAVSRKRESAARADKALDDIMSKWHSARSDLP